MGIYEVCVTGSLGSLEVRTKKEPEYLDSTRREFGMSLSTHAVEDS